MRIGLTGAPSSGKSSVAWELTKRRFHIFPEAATQIIEAEKSKWRKVKDIVQDADFQQRIYNLKRQQFFDYQEWVPSFYDTTFVDDIAHRRFWDIDTSDIEKFVRDNRYAVIFYLEHPWVVENNGIRIETPDEVQRLDTIKREALQDFWYTLIDSRKATRFKLDGTEAIILPVYAWLQNIHQRIETRVDDIERVMGSRR